MTDPKPTTEDTPPEWWGEALRDERALRFFAQQQEAEMRSKVAVWREKAEKRQARIQRLEKQIKELSTRPGPQDNPIPKTGQPKEKSDTHSDTSSAEKKPDQPESGLSQHPDQATPSITVSSPANPDFSEPPPSTPCTLGDRPAAPAPDDSHTTGVGSVARAAISVSPRETAAVANAPTPVIPHPKKPEPSIPIESRFPFLAAGLLAQGGQARLLADHFTTVPINERLALDQLGSLDLLLVSQSDYLASSDHVVNLLTEWGKLTGRGKLVVELDVPAVSSPHPRSVDLAKLVDRSDLVLTDFEESTDRDLASSSMQLRLFPLFHPTQSLPLAWPTADSSWSHPHPDHPAYRLWYRKEQLVAVECRDINLLDSPFPELWDWTSQGIPTVITGGPSLRLWLPDISVYLPISDPRILATDDEEWWQASLLTRRWAHHGRSSLVGAQKMLGFLDVPHPSPFPEVGLLLMSNRPKQLSGFLEQVVEFDYPRFHLLLGGHGFLPRIPRDFSRALENPGRKLSELNIPTETSLGEGLNRLAAFCSAPVLAKLDDDDYYGPNYLTDAVQALSYSGAEVVGKSTQYVYLAEDDRTYLILLGAEEQYRNQVNGPTLVFRRRIWEQAPFPHRTRGVDSGFLRGVRKAGGKIYATSRKEFILTRSAQGHTYETPAEHWRSRAKPAWPGHQPKRATVSL